MRAEVKGFAGRYFREAPSSSSPKLELWFLLPLPSDPSPCLLGAVFVVPVLDVLCCFMGVGQVCCDFPGVVRTLGFINDVV